jgi:hypothetical protein
MDEATQDQHEVHSVTEPKKRGRKPKDEIVLLASAVQEHDARRVELAQALASRIFAGQSPDLPMNDRLARVRAGLEAQGLSMDGVEL